jgi:1,2-phenylacetyl-CoA epoxidase catalytic subunit
MFWKKSAKTKDESAISVETEDSLKQRWLEKRTAELVAQGLTAEAAKAQALDEFKAKYSFTAAAKK